ncbi:MAG: carbohydrate kinase family protein [Clostridiales bacterium]|nr:carbohydrate kinase family protein [Clostridiales bacterium]
MEKKTEVLCIGIALVDSIIRGFDPEPVSASGYRAASGTLSIGGEAVNQSVAAARLGLNAGILCALGADAAGDLVVSGLEKAGVCTDRIIRPEGHATPVTTMFVREDGTRKSITNQAHRYNFHPEKQVSRLAGTRAVILGSLFRAPFDDPEIIRAVLQSAKDAGAAVFADTKLPNFRFLTLDDLADALPMIDYITPNGDEARYYTGKEDPAEMAEVFLGYGIRNVIIKLGAEGCYFRNAREEIRLPALPVRAVDSTGAGDCFIAGFVSEILRGSTHKEALRFANACGAICTTAVGAGTALESRAQVMEFLNR